jgi:hypothetical protein
VTLLTQETSDFAGKPAPIENSIKHTSPKSAIDRHLISEAITRPPPHKAAVLKRVCNQIQYATPNGTERNQLDEAADDLSCIHFILVGGVGLTLSGEQAAC